MVFILDVACDKLQDASKQSVSLRPESVNAQSISVFSQIEVS